MLSMSPQEPKTIYATMWDFRRQGWTFRSGGAGSGIFKSTDGGDHWTETHDANARACPTSHMAESPLQSRLQIRRSFMP